MERGTVSAPAWQVLVFGVVGACLAGIVGRAIAIARMPLHLRWELAPVPHDEGKGGYGGSYLGEYEWWTKPRRRSRTAVFVYMAKEMFLLRSVRKYNPGLWPLSLAFHYGLYLIAGFTLLLATHSVCMAIGLVSPAVQPVHKGFSALALLGYMLGSLGTVGLLLRRGLDPRLRSFSTVSRYLNLLFLAAVFLSGGYACMHSGDYGGEVSRFAHSLITLDADAKVAFPFSLHFVLSLLFLLYLPLTDMIHFIAKYFTYHAVRWDDRPQNEPMQRQLRGLLRQPVTWSASHINSDGPKNWADTVGAESSSETTS